MEAVGAFQQSDRSNYDLAKRDNELRSIGCAVTKVAV